MPNDGNIAKNKTWCSSTETKKALKIGDCDLMHMRLAGKLEFEKRGRGYLYLIDKNSFVADSKPTV